MATNDKSNVTTTVTVRLQDEVSDAARDAALSVEEMRARMKASEASIKELSGTLRRLRGTTDEVKQAKDELKARLTAERDAISSVQLQMLRQKAAADALTERTRALAKAKEQAGGVTGLYYRALSRTSAASSNLRERASRLGGQFRQLAQESLRSVVSLETLSKVAKLAAAGMAAAVAAAVAGVGAAFVFAIRGADAARSASLMREAFAGSAENGKALGTQIDALATKVPTGKAALDQLAGSLLKAGLGGETLVDALNATAQASAALGDDAGGKIRELLERGKISGRFGIQSLGNGFDELQGTGISRDNVAKALAKDLKISIDDARASLASGQVSLQDGAKAVRRAIEQQFGDLNARKALSLESLFTKAKESLSLLTNGIKLEPLLRAVQDFFSLFDESTVAGDALKTLVTVFGNQLVGAVQLVAPLTKSFFKGMIIAGLQTGIMLLKLKNYFRDTFGGNETLKRLFSVEAAFRAGRAAAIGLVTGVAILATALGAVAGLAAVIGDSIQRAIEFGADLVKSLTEVNWSSLGKDLADGLLAGFRRVVDGVKNVAGEIKQSFKDSLGIRSPSKVFASYGEDTAEGYEQGLERRTPAVARSLDSMTQHPSVDRPKSRSTSAVTINIPITINASGGDSAKQLSSPDFMASLTKAIEDALLGAGIPVT